MKREISVTSLSSLQNNYNTQIDGDRYIVDSFLKNDKSIKRLPDYQDSEVGYTSLQTSNADFHSIIPKLK